MPDIVTINEELSLIEVKSFGIVSADDIYDSLKKAKSAMLETGISKLLVDTTEQKQMPGTVNIFQIFSTIPKEIEKAAIIIKEDQSTADDLKFAENVAVNRGTVLKLFKSRDEALEWLNEL